MDRPRILWLDLARTAALVGMVIYHFSYDLVLFGRLAAEAVTSGPLRWLAVATAASFVGLAGVSLQVAHGRALRLTPFLKRLGLLVAAAAAISLLTWMWVPQSYIFFGILHSIAACSVLGLAFLRAPFWVTGLASAVVFAAPSYVALPLFDAPFLQWVGLGTYLPVSLDYEPIFPWFAAFLAGMTLAKLLEGTPALLPRPVSGVARWLAWPGQKSLWIYLAHQPVLIALLWLVFEAV